MVDSIEKKGYYKDSNLKNEAIIHNFHQFFENHME